MTLLSRRSFWACAVIASAAQSAAEAAPNRRQERAVRFIWGPIQYRGPAAWWSTTAARTMLKRCRKSGSRWRIGGVRREALALRPRPDVIDLAGLASTSP